MSWLKEHIGFGVVKIDKLTVRVYTTQNNYSTINIGQELKDVRWSGGVLLVYLKDGKVRRYTSQISYSTISN